MVLVTPGIRPAGADKGDQKRIMTPADAARAGSTYIVVGRPILQAADPAVAGGAAARASRATPLTAGMSSPRRTSSGALRLTERLRRLSPRWIDHSPTIALMINRQ